MDFESTPDGLTLHVRALPTQYRLGYSFGGDSVEWVHDFGPDVLPIGFDGAMFALVATGHSQPWPYDAPEVGFRSITEEYFDEGWTDYQSEQE